MPDEALVAAIRQLLRGSPFHGEGYRKLGARLRFSGIRTSRRGAAPAGARARPASWPTNVLAGHMAHAPTMDGTITTEQVEVMWGTDLTSVMTGEGQAAVFIAVDHRRQRR